LLSDQRETRLEKDLVDDSFEKDIAKAFFQDRIIDTTPQIAEENGDVSSERNFLEFMDFILNPRPEFETPICCQNEEASQPLLADEQVEETTSLIDKDNC